METTRRGFLGLLGAFVAAPAAGIKAVEAAFVQAEKAAAAEAAEEAAWRADWKAQKALRKEAFVEMKRLNEETWQHSLAPDYEGYLVPPEFADSLLARMEQPGFQARFRPAAGFRGVSYGYQRTPPRLVSGQELRMRELRLRGVSSEWDAECEEGEWT